MTDRVRDYNKTDHLGPAHSVPTTTRAVHDDSKPGETGFKKGCMKFLYNRETKEYCGRTCKSWLCIIVYGFFYLMFLTSFFLLILYPTLLFIKKTAKFEPFQPRPLIYPKEEVGLTAIPSSGPRYPLIWYYDKDWEAIDKYVSAIDKIVIEDRHMRKLSDFGPCAVRPYGYGQSPCIFIKVNKQFFWTGTPLQDNSTLTKEAPSEVLKWMKTQKNKLWLQCKGYHSYDQEHIGNIKYYPDPPALDPGLFPMNKDDNPPYIAIQVSNFTYGLSLAIECKLWYENGPSMTDFLLYVAPVTKQTLFRRPAV